MYKYLKRTIFFLLCFSVSNIRPEGLWNLDKRKERRDKAKKIRNVVAKLEADTTHLHPQDTNGDLHRYANHMGSFSKNLSHNTSGSFKGFVKDPSFQSLLDALKSGKSHKFDEIILGTTTPGHRRLTDPQAAYAFSLEGKDAAAPTMPAVPKLASAEAASEMVELYWMALLRDVPFDQYGTDASAQDAVTDLNNMSDFRGPKITNLVTDQTLFRGITPGELDGPYISQFFYQPIPDHGKLVEQKYFGYKTGPGTDFLTSFNTGPTGTTWLESQNGVSPSPATPLFNSNATYIHTGRDLGTYIHKDTPGEAFFNAAFILFRWASIDPNVLDDNHPYKMDPTQEGFVSYGIVEMSYLLGVALETAMKAAWYQKWLVHLRPRPEFLGFLAAIQTAGAAGIPLHSDLINSTGLADTNTTFGSYLLPQMYPEGSPTHPAYPSGHATIAGACTTILKAFFNESYILDSSTFQPKKPDSTGANLLDYNDTTLSIGDELNKLATNCGMGRNFAGIHYRTDCIEGMLLGEKIAISILKEEGFLKNSNFQGFSLTKFNGETITIGKKQTVSLD